MAGTDASRLVPAGAAAGAAPAVVLVDPQLGENIGMAARAMHNCALADLRLVRPRDGWPNDSAVAAASGADCVLEKARLFDTTEDAIKDLQRVYAATTRHRDMTKTTLLPRPAAAEMRTFAASGGRSGVLFGPEAKGLTNDDVALADAVLTVPLNPGFSSLNLAHAVLVVGYEWLHAAAAAPPPGLSAPKNTRPATKEELIGMFEHLERELDACGFLHVSAKRPYMVRNLRNIFQRAGLTDQEVRTLRGVIAALTGGRKGPGG